MIQKLVVVRVDQPVFTLPGDDVPHTHVVVGGGGAQLVAAPAPGEGAHGVDVGRDDLGDAAGQEVSDNDPAVIATYGEQRPKPVETAGHCHGDTVKRPVELLGVILPEGFEKLEIHFL